MASKGITNLGFDLLRYLPRVTMNNIKSLKKTPVIIFVCFLLFKFFLIFLYIKQTKRGRGQHGGDKHGCGHKSGQRQNYMPLGFETGNTPFHIRMPFEPYYKNLGWVVLKRKLFRVGGKRQNLHDLVHSEQIFCRETVLFLKLKLCRKTQLINISFTGKFHLISYNPFNESIFF